VYARAALHVDKRRLRVRNCYGKHGLGFGRYFKINDLGWGFVKQRCYHARNASGLRPSSPAEKAACEAKQQVLARYLRSTC
jgi:hypothetical protein